jgi:hypothetical protein
MSTLPSASVLLRAAQVAMEQDRPIYLDYYAESVAKTCCIGVNEQEKFLVKSDSEYTSTVQNVFKCENCYIVMTENSLYIVSAEIPIKKIVAPSKDE